MLTRSPVTFSRLRNLRCLRGRRRGKNVIGEQTRVKRDERSRQEKRRARRNLSKWSRPGERTKHEVQRHQSLSNRWSPPLSSLMAISKLSYLAWYLAELDRCDRRTLILSDRDTFHPEDNEHGRLQAVERTLPIRARFDLAHLTGRGTAATC